ncbi:kynurenine formamidase-like protein [Corchorus capsularis]|uniref:Kynurenine formamidase-like protein n=1 Tax=Corchorus capsularis TaxID=210143 RepID=A0A1R3HUE7_COCAP|nr:kynurenine formamidase-like protein [Corchorus capsularis]
MTSLFLHFLLIVSSAFTSTATTAYPSIPGTDSTTDCGLSGGDEILKPIRREVYGDGRIFDISHRENHSARV